MEWKFQDDYGLECSVEWHMDGCRGNIHAYIKHFGGGVLHEREWVYLSKYVCPTQHYLYTLRR